MAAPVPDSENPGVGVVTVSYGSDLVLPGFLQSLPGASAGALSVVVADNRASDSAAAEGAGIEKLVSASGARYAPMTGNLGYGAAMNAGVDLLPENVRWILLSNPDVVLSPGAIDTLVRAGEEDEKIAAVGPAVLTIEGEVYPSARAVPSLRTGVGHALFVNLWVENPWTRAYRNDRMAETVRRDAGWLSGACLLVRRSAFEQLRGFDPGYFMYFEDVDLGYRLGKAGYRSVYEPAAVVTHSGAHATTTESGRMISAHHESARRFLNRKYSGAWLWPVRVTLTIGLQLRSALVRRRLADE
jgi:N-acetylglucosaminyl-diphospho-decaprenol L-rhamnosyltransferase